MAEMVKEIGCRQAYDFRSCRKPRPRAMGYGESSFRRVLRAATLVADAAPLSGTTPFCGMLGSSERGIPRSPSLVTEGAADAWSGRPVPRSTVAARSQGSRPCRVTRRTSRSLLALAAARGTGASARRSR